MEMNKSEDSYPPSPQCFTSGEQEQLPSDQEVFVFPASFTQERLWFFEQWEPGAYNVGLTTIPQGEIDLGAMERALQEIGRRHEILRTTFSMVDSQLYQLVSSQSGVYFSYLDLCMFPRDVQRAKLNDIIKSEARHLFDLSRDPLLRVIVAKVRPDRHVIHFNMHHIISDGWSIEVLMREISTLYVAYISGQPSPLPELPLQYADYAVWQKQCFEDGELDPHLDYWREQLRDLPVLQLPFDRPRPAIQRFHGSKRLITIPPHLHSALTALSQQAGVTLFMTLLAAFQTLLHRYSSQESIAVGTPIAGRDGSKLELLIGCFLNVLVLRTSFSGNPSFWELLKRVREIALDAYEYQDIPFEKLVEMIQPERELSHHPLFQAMFALENLPHTTKLANARLTPLSEAEQAELFLGEDYTNHSAEKHSEMFKNETAIYDIHMSLHEQKEKLFGEIEYNTHIFDPSTIDRMHDHFLALLQHIVQDPMQRVDSIPLLLPEEQRRNIETSDSLSGAGERASSVLTGFLEQVHARPDALAVSDAQRQLTYAELLREARTVARYLRIQNILPEQLVGLFVERSVSWVAGLLGILFAGGAYLPLDPRYPTLRIRQFVQQSGCQLLLTSLDQQEQAGKLCAGIHEAGSMPPQVLYLEHAYDSVLDHSGGDEDLIEPQEQQLAYVLYTSGSTGLPKGAMVEHSGMLNHLHCKIAALDLSEKDVVAQTASACFDISIWQVLAPLLAGGSVRIYADTVVWNAQELCEQIVRDDVTILEIVPSWLRGLLDLDLPVQPQSNRARLGKLRWLITTGEALQRDLCQQWLQRYPEVPVLNAYGPTECSDDVTHYVLSHGSREKEYEGVLPIGTALPGLHTYVLNEQMQVQPVGVDGEIYVGGIGVGRGYLEEADKTAAIFVPDPWSSQPGGRLYRTGDTGRYRNDGVILFNGRKDEQIKLRGYRIELGEIEQTVQKLPGVKECRVMKRVAQTQAGERLVAYVICEEGYEGSRALLSRMKEELPDYMLPSAIVVVEEWPLLPNGKLDKESLPDPQEKDGLARQKTYVAPHSETEKKLATIWSGLLGTQQVGVHDDFFALGGYSLLTVQLVKQIKVQFGARISLTAIFREPTIAAIAQILQLESEKSVLAAQEEHTQKPVSLLDDAVLASSITPELGTTTGREHVPQHALLTGATGFLGTFLLAELLGQTSMHIHCLMRASSETEGKVRLQQKLEEAKLWQEEWSSRIHPLIGDLDRPQLGLSAQAWQELARQIDVIYHNGAYVNMVYPYEVLRSANVLGTKEIIRLAMTHQLKPVHYISTLNVMGDKDEEHILYGDEHAVIDACWQYLQGGYAQSKWVAEKLMHEARTRGLPVVVYRPGTITGFPHRRAAYEGNTFAHVLRGCIAAGQAPASTRKVTLQKTPVDYLGRAIVALSRQDASLGETFHFSRVSQVEINDIIQWLNTFGYSVQPVAYQVWHANIMRLSGADNTGNANLSDYLSLFPSPDQPVSGTSEERTPSGEFGSEFTQAALTTLSIRYPEVNESQFHAYLASLIQTGELPLPEPEKVYQHLGRA